MSSKLSNKASEKLMSLLYNATSQKVAPTLPRITKHLYDNNNQTDQNQSSSSYLDTLVKNDWNLKPMIEAVKDLPLRSNTHLHSNILKFNCVNSFITANDFKSIYPNYPERTYSIIPKQDESIVPTTNHSDLQFNVIKSRQALNLQFQHSYYLIFPNYIQACVYYNEVLHKTINGFELTDFQFVDPTEQELKNMISPHYQTYSLSPGLFPSKTNISTIKFNHLFPSNQQSQLVKDITALTSIKSEPSSTYTLEQAHTPHPNYNLLIDLINPNIRGNMVLVKNLPFGLSKHTLPRLLWNYDLNDRNPIISIIKDPKHQINTSLIKFKNPTNAQRFFRNFHGKKWDKFQHHQKEKILYDPILCEIIN
ncbi:hypothetical protein DFJ63DRAFT_316613 [Scheffersomyces coipomensis]|uniref:uncharacterized protein n=1 Tax=Scheffersomyces coipomensis TaxID=1788519 RepID=UPI00315C9D36